MGLRQAMQILRDATCPTCGKRIAVMATNWRGRGTGQHGASHYDATSFEDRTAESHCTCAQNDANPVHPSPDCPCNYCQGREPWPTGADNTPPTLREMAERQRTHYERTGQLIVGDEPEVR